jgi:hypothetical protein
MSGKAGCVSKPSNAHAGRGPDGTVKARLPEPQCPHSKACWSGLTVDTLTLPEKPSLQPKADKIEGSNDGTPGRWVASNNLTDTNEAPKPS